MSKCVLKTNIIFSTMINSFRYSPHKKDSVSYPTSWSVHLSESNFQTRSNLPYILLPAYVPVQSVLPILQFYSPEFLPRVGEP
ncbi:DUF6783 domain-containing protein [uncultured Robinsoniella sp.]|uniref:DUF6783 domain-containing protein n=1 Tax=uncultured Robinsoniella sp. TaxID=904190 RepID=UPI00374E8339